MDKFVVKSAEELAAMDSTQQAAYFLSKNDHDKAQLKEAIDGKAGEKELTELRDSIVKEHNDNIQRVYEILKEQGEAINRQGGATPKERNTIRKGLEANASKLKAMKGSDGRNSGFSISGEDFHVKAPMTLASNIVGGAQIPQALRLPGYNDLPQRPTRLLDIVQFGGIDSNVVEWVYLTNEDGTTGPTAEGASKNNIDFDWALGTERVEKTTNYIKISTEMLDDISFMETAVRTQLNRKLLQAVEGQVYAGSGTTPNMRGIRTVASAFAAGAFANAVNNPNEIDVVTVAMNQIRVAQETDAAASAVLMHPTDVTKLKMIKVSATDLRYVERLWMNAGSLSIDEVPIIETTLVTQGQYLVGDFSKAHVLEKQAPTVQIGLDASDFTTNFRTLLAEWRGVTYVMNNDRSAFVAGTFATDKAAIETS